MTTKISTLPSLATVTDATIIPVVEGGATKRITGAALKTYTGTASGPQGPSGPSGAAGSNGSAGATGPQGPSGPGTLNSGTAGYVPYYSGTTTLSAPTGGNLFWDNTNGRLGIGTTTPGNTLDVATSSSSLNLQLHLRNTGGTKHTGFLASASDTPLGDSYAWGMYGGPNSYLSGLTNAVGIGIGTSVPRFQITRHSDLNHIGDPLFVINSTGTVMVGTTSYDSTVTKLLVYDYADGKVVAKISGYGGNTSAAGTYALHVEQNCDNNGGGSAALYVKHTNINGGSPASLVTFYGGFGSTGGKVFDMGSAGGLTLNIPNTAFGSTIMSFQYAGVSKGTITVSSGGTAYNTSSDRRLKDNIASLTGSGTFIDSLQPRTWDWRADGSSGVGFIADEVAVVSPGTVHGEADKVDSNGDPVYQVMEYGSAEFIANIVAELQSLRARVAQLEAKG